MDKCIFCGWHHKNDDATLKFFGIPKEPGLKRVQWLQAIGDRMITPRDKVSIYIKYSQDIFVKVSWSQYF